MLTFGSLFAGIGGMDLGLERAGMKCVWQAEIDPYARRELEKHWPDVRRHDDVRTFPPGRRPRAEDWKCDLIAGGFPCQDLSKAGNVQGKRQGIGGERSGLWLHFADAVQLLRPRFVLVENVARLLVGGLGRILGDLATLGYDAEWHCLPAAYFGTPHIRDRVFVLAYTGGERVWMSGCPPIIRTPPPVQGEAQEWSRLWTHPHAMGPLDGVESDRNNNPWKSEPRVGRLVDGVSDGLVQLANRAYGNAVVPQVAEWIGRQIVAAANGTM